VQLLHHERIANNHLPQVSTTSWNRPGGQMRCVEHVPSLSNRDRRLDTLSDDRRGSDLVIAASELRALGGLVMWLRWAERKGRAGSIHDNPDSPRRSCYPTARGSSNRRHTTAAALIPMAVAAALHAELSGDASARSPPTVPPTIIALMVTTADRFISFPLSPRLADVLSAVSVH
jgi:hypothetical protein